MMVNPKTREQISIREDILATLRRVGPHADVLHSREALEEIERAAARVQEVVRAAVEMLRRPC